MFPMPNDRTFNTFHWHTIVDGELVIDLVNGAPKRRLLLFDCLVLDGQNLMEKTFDRRLGRLKDYFLEPHDLLVSSNEIYRNNLPFTVELKKLEFAYDAKKVIEQQPLLNHGSDGLLFTARDEPYVISRCDSMCVAPCFLCHHNFTHNNLAFVLHSPRLKWKPKNTVDFRLRFEALPQPHFCLQILQRDNTHHDVSVLTLDDEMEATWIQDPQSYDGRIVECAWEADWLPHHWKFERFRNDKNTANFVVVYEDVMDSIRNPVTQEEVCCVVVWLYDVVPRAFALICCPCFPQLLARMVRVKEAWKEPEP